MPQGVEPKLRLGEVTESEYHLIVRGLECLKKALLDEAAGFARTKVSYKKGSLEDITKLGRERLEQVQAASAMQERWRAKFRKQIP